MNPSIPLRSRRPRIRGPKGFTLVELVVTILIVAILAAIAIPGYSSYVLKSHRTDAKTALTDMASLEERYFSVNNTYTANPNNLGYTATASTVPPNLLVGSGYYNITALTVVAATVPTATTAGAPATYTITAQPTGNQVKDNTSCASFTITSQGVESALNSAGTDATAACWQQ